MRKSAFCMCKNKGAEHKSERSTCVDNIHVLYFKSRQIEDRSKQMLMVHPFESVKKCFSQ